jgi:hypothetical protein
VAAQIGELRGAVDEMEMAQAGAADPEAGRQAILAALAKFLCVAEGGRLDARG